MKILSAKCLLLVAAGVAVTAISTPEGRKTLHICSLDSELLGILGEKMELGSLQCDDEARKSHRRPKKDEAPMMPKVVITDDPLEDIRYVRAMNLEGF